MNFWSVASGEKNIMCNCHPGEDQTPQFSVIMKLFSCTNKNSLSIISW